MLLVLGCTEQYKRAEMLWYASQLFCVWRCFAQVDVINRSRSLEVFDEVDLTNGALVTYLSVFVVD